MMVIATLPVPRKGCRFLTRLGAALWLTTERPLQKHIVGENHFPGSRFWKIPRLGCSVHL